VVKKEISQPLTLGSLFDGMLDAKKKAYAEYRALKTETRAVLTAKANVDVLLGVDEREHERGQEWWRSEL
jgi:hypothetical protein